MITHIVGNRPQFIKLAPLYHELDRRGYNQKIIHTGQHYDTNMSEIFFRELEIPRADVNLGVGSGTHAEMTSAAMLGVEKTLMDIQPELVIVYGDTDSTLAASIASCKLNISIAHVEAGGRSRDPYNPEEKNRIVTDHLSDILFAPDEISVKNAIAEGLGNKVHFTGDIMYDTYLETEESILQYEGEQDDTEIVLMTWHRQENTSSRERMESILNFIEQVQEDIICPLHPRTVKCLKQFDIWEKAIRIPNFHIMEPVGYREMVGYLRRAKLVITDSGGLSKESSFSGSKCLFLLAMRVWPALTDCGWIQNIDCQRDEDVKRGLDAVRNAVRVPYEERPRVLGEGHAASVIADLLESKRMI